MARFYELNPTPFQEEVKEDEESKLKRIPQDQKTKELLVRPEKHPCRILVIAVPLNTAEQDQRKKQYDYFVEHLPTQRSYEPAYHVATTPSNVINLVNWFTPVDALYLLCHGTKNGFLEFPDHVYVPPHSLRDAFSLRRQPAGFSVWTSAHCYNYIDRKGSCDRIFDYETKFLFQQTTSRDSLAKKVTWNIARGYVDSKEGWIHTALNPEIMDLENVQHYILTNLNSSWISNVH